MPGVQVLFAFLLAVPFQQRFAASPSSRRTSTSSRCCAAALASALFIAPTALSPAACFQRPRQALSRAASRASSTLAGLVFLAVAMSGAVLLVTDVLFDGAVVTVTIAIAAAALRRAVVRPRPRAAMSGGRLSRLMPEHAARRDPRRRRHARRLQLPARARLVPRVSPARHHDPGLALPSRDRDGRRPARALSRRRGLRGARRATPSALRGARAVRADDPRGAALRGRPRAHRGPQGARLQDRARVLGEVRGRRRLPRPARRPRARRRLDGLQQRRAHEARAGPRRGGVRARRRRPGGHDRRLDLGRARRRRPRRCQTICVRTGGFGADELREAGAAAVFESIVELRERLSETPFG